MAIACSVSRLNKEIPTEEINDHLHEKLRVTIMVGKSANEMVEFRAEQAGTFQLYLLTRSCTKAPKYVGYAWWVGP